MSEWVNTFVSQGFEDDMTVTCLMNYECIVCGGCGKQNPRQKEAALRVITSEWVDEMTDTNGWQPIETVPDVRVLMWMAPRDWLPEGAIILDRPPPRDGYHITGSIYAFPLYKWSQEMGITHWQPLPEPPRETT